MDPYITKDGREIPLRAVGRRYVDQIRARHPLPEVPTYTATTVAGDKETHPHQLLKDADGNVLKTTLQTEEEWAEWRAYERGTEAAIAAQYADLTEFLLCECIPLEAAPAETWSVNVASWGLDVPDAGAHPAAFKAFWVENELLPDPDDLTGVLARLYAKHGIIAQDKATEFESFFRLILARLTTVQAVGAAAGEAQDPRPARRNGDPGAGAVRRQPEPDAAGVRSAAPGGAGLGAGGVADEAEAGADPGHRRARAE